MNTFQINQKVERVGSEKDYTTGRKGIIVEINGDRCRVRWTEERTGLPVATANSTKGNGVRTWVNKKFLRLINCPA